jgi:hypothetical protein
MDKQKRLSALPFIGLVVAVLLIAAIYLISQNMKQAKALTDLQDTVARQNEAAKTQGRPIDPRDYPIFSPAPVGDIKTTSHTLSGVTVQVPATWQAKEDNGLIIFASQNALLDAAIIPADQGKLTIARAAMSWVANVEQLAGAYMTSSKKFTVNDRQVFETTNEDKSTGVTWKEAYIVPASTQGSYTILTVYPATSPAAMNAYQTALRSIKVSE